MNMSEALKAELAQWLDENQIVYLEDLLILWINLHKKISNN